MDKNLKILMDIIESKIGIRLVKQVFCVLLLVFGVEKKLIIEKLGVSRLSVKKYDELLQNGKIEELFQDNVYRRKSEMENYTEQIMAELDKTPPKTLREAAVIIEKTTGLKRGITQVRNFLKKTDTDR